MLKVRTWLLLSALLVAAVVAFNFLKRAPSSDVATTTAATAHAAIEPKAATTKNADTEIPSAPPADPSVVAVDEAEHDDLAFRTDPAGQLLLDERTRLNIEALIAQTESSELHSAVREQTEELAPIATKQAAELVEKIIRYQQAQRQLYPPDNAPLTADDAVAELEGLHALREAHFGPELARQLYGKEEAIAREMVEVLRVENDQSLTPPERAERSKALREQLPGIAIIERNNRHSAAMREQQENN